MLWRLRLVSASVQLELPLLHTSQSVAVTIVDIIYHRTATAATHLL
jgi:hypothetical protein